MSDGECVPMEPRQPMIDGHEVEVRTSELTRRFGRRFELIVDENVLRRLPQEAIAHSLTRLSESVVARHQDEIRRAVSDYIHDREWAEPIIKDAVYKAVREIMEDILNSRPPETDR